MLAVDTGQTLEIETAAIRLLSQSEQSFAQLKKKLLAKGFDDEPVAEVLAALQQQNLQSDRRYTEQYLLFRSQKGFGPMRISRELHERGIEERLLETVLEEMAPDWTEIMQAALEKKFGHTPALNFNDQARRARFLEYRGFPSSLIRQLVFD